MITEPELKDKVLDYVSKNPADPVLYSDLMGIVNKQEGLHQSRKEQLLGSIETLFNPEKNISQSLQLAFLRADNYFLYEALLDPDKLKDGYAGACVLIAYFLKDRIYVANAGDCRAVLGRKRDTSGYALLSYLSFPFLVLAR